MAPLYAALKYAESDVIPASGNGPPTSDQEKLAKFRDAGFALIDNACQFYITSKTDQQRSVNTWRDSFAPITALVAGAIPLVVSGGNVDKDIVRGLSLATATASSGLDIYEQRYLFGVKNVEGVRSLVIDALNTHATKARNLDAGKLTYGKAVFRITEHQVICSPSAISNLVAESIKVAKTVATSKENVYTDSLSTNPITINAE